MATSYAPPSPVDLAYDSDTSTALRAESSLSYELGIRQALMEGKLDLSFVLFCNKIDDLLSYEPTTYDTFNIEKATTEGIELAANYQATDTLEFGLGYTYLRAVSNRLNDPRSGGFVADPASNVPLARRPRHLVQAGLWWQAHEDLLLGVQAIAQLNREDINPTTYLQEEAEDFMVWRMVANFKINDTWSITGRIENLLDENYSSAKGYPALGRAAYFGAKMSF
jgi:vitamin B12 transporter